MKSSFLRNGAALLLTLSLAACGGSSLGGTAQYTIQGTISNLTNSGMVLASNGQTVSPAAGDTTFTFPNTIDYGVEFNVLVQTQPNHMTCSVGADGNSSAGHTIAIDATVACVQNTYTVGGTISGLSVAGLVLGNGSATTYTPVAADTTFTMPDVVADGTSYGITVLVQPTGLTCTVANGTGVMGSAAIANVAVTCVANS